MRILFLDRSTRLSTIHDLTGRARGGMVSSLRVLPDKLAGMGHDCSVLAEIEQPGKTDAGVWWSNEYNGNRVDVLVFNRGVGHGAPEIDARRRVLWTHDLPHNGFIPDPKIMGAVAATVFMSRYSERVWRTFYRTIGRSFTIPNGVDRERFYPRRKDLDYLIYASAPNRGLKRLPLIFEAARHQTRPDMYMRAYSNLAVMHPNEVEGDDGRDGFELHYQAIRESEVELHDPLPQSEFAGEIGRAGLMVLPTGYPEICSNVILQSLACGTPVITTGRLGSAGEWLVHGKNAMLTQFQVADYMVYQMEMVRNAVAVLNDENKHRRMIENAAKTKLLTWDEVAHKWERMLHKIL
jgi:glycosyltransferase involved in cell wall biosynthesis